MIDKQAKEKARNMAELCYMVNMIRLLLKMDMISEDEYERLVHFSTEYCDSGILCV